MSVQYYRLCPLGHKVICKNSLVRPPCPICGQIADDMSPPHRMDEETKEIVQEQQEQTAVPEPNEAASEQGVQAPNLGPGEAARRRRQANRNLQAEPEMVPDEGHHPRTMAEGRRRRTAGSAAQPVEAAAGGESLQDTPTGAVWLDLFGVSIPIPADGGFLGRDGIGAHQLEGYLLVSRQHVFVKPDRGGRLMAEDRGSMNGTWYTHDSARQRLEQGRAVILEFGDILWLYNIPLKVVTEHV